MQLVKQSSNTTTSVIQPVGRNTVSPLSKEDTGSSLSPKLPSTRRSSASNLRPSLSRTRSVGSQSLLLEAEDMTLSGYSRKSASYTSGGAFAELTKGKGSATVKFTGASGKYDLSLGYFDESDGRASFRVRVNNSTVASFRADQTTGSTTTDAKSLTQRTVAKGVSLTNGQTISIEGSDNKGDEAAIDYLRLTPIATPTPVEPTKAAPVIPVTPTPVTPVTPPKPPAAGTALWRDDFSGDWKSRWQVGTQGAFGATNLQPIANGNSTGNATALRVRFPAGSASPAVARSNNRAIGGAQFLGDGGVAPRDSMRLSYSLRFSDGFDFVKGGKLPGLYGGNAPSGGEKPNGTDGFSARFMWRSGGDGEVYAYLPTSTSYGTSLGRGSWKFKPNVWHRLEQEVVLNQPGQDNGSIRVWLDGKQVWQDNRLRFRTTDKLKVDGIFFSTFFGGGDTSWATPKDVSIDFADFALSAV
ncbi:MAG: hypothetical protein HC881_02160 [Leptolyngbyaceae cyanobacterium SL_7_1]|nr:hypothetical protein [Leptolyngbyaceae cyanobacterium SL_7_1]